MSFSADTKKEICKNTPKKSCCLKAECYGLFLFAKKFLPTGIVLTTENHAVARFSASLAASVTGAIFDVTTTYSHRKNSNSIYTITVPGEDQVRLVRKLFGHMDDELSVRINRSNLENLCCQSAFLKGVFLSCGTVTNPEKDYHLEFIVPYLNLAKDLVTLLSEVEELGLQASIINRKGSFVVYLKESEQIADLLTYLGAANASMELMQIKMLKEMRNYVNRKTNFETANIGKTVTASAQQIVAIEKIRRIRGLESLPDDLREIAVLRLENPEMSLRELGGQMKNPISRSGVNHRLMRLQDIANDL